LLSYRRRASGIEVLLVHPGGPFFSNKDDGAWTIPKGLIEENEDPLVAARREFLEETGMEPHEPFFPLSTVKQRGGKTIHAWAFEGDCDPTTIKSNPFTLEWPPRSGKQETFPEIDRATFFDVATAGRKINPAQAIWLHELSTMLGGAPSVG
jgi:predicted NUDIX family NTP pyrophosphohydrolase